MINRELIRQKVVHIVYSYYTNEGQNLSAIEKNLLTSMDNAYELYHTLLRLLTDMGRIIQRNHEAAVNRANRLGIKAPSGRMAENRFMLQLQDNKEIKAYENKEVIDWNQEEEFVRSLVQQAMRLEAVEEYMYADETTYEQDREVWRTIYRQVIVGNEALENLLEDKNLFWNDDKDVIDTFVIKTINRFTLEAGDEQPLLPQYKDMSDRDYAVELLHAAISNAEASLKLISESAKGWELERIALMDRIIMQIALAEMQAFPSIPVQVSINEYVEIAKMYSTPKSARYINATLENLASKMSLGKE